MSINYLSAKNLTLGYGNSIVIKNLALSLYDNKDYEVIGRNGAGKSTLLNFISNNFQGNKFDSKFEFKNFVKNLIMNVSSILYFSQKKKFNSIIINYDEQSESIFKWYQQLVAESLGKKQKGILPIISNMPKDNHSVMQLYLDGFKNNFFTFFYTKDENSQKIKSNLILDSQKFLTNKKISEIIEKRG